MYRVLVCLLLSTKMMGALAFCDDSSNRTVHGPEPIASSLYSAAKATDMGAWKDGTFYTEDFFYLGDFNIAKGPRIYVTYIETIWGSSCRSTRRLIFFNSKFEQVGQYNSIEKPELIKPNTLLIPYEEQPKTIWEFKGALPDCLEVADDCFTLENATKL